MAKQLLTFALMTWWAAGMWWVVQQANGKQLADIRPRWHRYCAVFLTAPFYFTFVLFIRICEFVTLLAKDAARTWKVFTDTVNGIPQPTEDEEGNHRG